MRILADENIDDGIVEQLRDAGHEIWYVTEMTPGIGDDEVLAQANRHGALLLTGDKDFGELVYRQQRINAGVLFIRLAGLTAAAKARMVTRAIDDHGAGMMGRFTVIAPGQVRIRR